MNHNLEFLFTPNRDDPDGTRDMDIVCDSRVTATIALNREELEQLYDTLEQVLFDPTFG